jgi:hypothetical protein
MAHWTITLCRGDSEDLSHPHHHPSDPADVARHDRMVALVEKMLDLM